MHTLRCSCNPGNAIASKGANFFGVRNSSGGFGRRSQCNALEKDNQKDIELPPLLFDRSVNHSVLQEYERKKLNGSDDVIFYSVARMSAHVDDHFSQTLTKLYIDKLQPEIRVLDLMSSNQSHLPDDVNFNSNLNEDQKLPFENENFDAVLCSLSVQYLQFPEDIFAEVERVLAPNGLFIISFSTPLFKEKAAVWWLERNMQERVLVVRQLLNCAGFLQTRAITPSAMDDKSDPFYAVIGQKLAVRERSSPEPDSYQYTSFPTETLRDVPEFSAMAPSERVIEAWVSAYKQLQMEAMELGIPAYAIPELTEPISAGSIAEARNTLRGIIESMLSSEL